MMNIKVGTLSLAVLVMLNTSLAQAAGLGMRCEKPTINSATAEEAADYTFQCTNTSRATFNSFTVTPVELDTLTPGTVTVGYSDWTHTSSNIQPGDSVTVSGTMTLPDVGDYVYDFDAAFGGESYSGIYCKLSPSDACINVATSEAGGAIWRGLAGGSYRDPNISSGPQGYPLLIDGNNGPVNSASIVWSYTNLRSLFTDLVPDNFSNQVSTMADKGGTSIVTGNYHNDEDQYPKFILYRNTPNQGWQSATIPSPLDLDGGYFSASACASGTYCVAGGRHNVSSFTIPFLLDSDGLNSWEIIDTDALLPATLEDGYTLAAACTPTHCAVGGEFTNSAPSKNLTDPTAHNSFPFIISGTHGSYTYTDVSTLPDSTITDTDSGDVETIACNATNTCVAGGFTYTTDNDWSPLLLAYVDSTWTFLNAASIPSMPTVASGMRIEIAGTACSGATCVGVGNYEQYNEELDDNMDCPLVVTLHGNASNISNWSFIDLSHATSTPTLSNTIVSKTTCINDQVCLAAGSGEFINLDPYEETYYALIWRTTDGGNTWSFINVNTLLPTLTRNINVSSLSCSGQNCLFTAQLDSGEAPFLLSSTNGGQSWVYQAVSAIPGLAENFSQGLLTSGTSVATES